MFLICMCVCTAVLYNPATHFLWCIANITESNPPLREYECVCCVYVRVCALIYIGADGQEGVSCLTRADSGHMHFLCSFREREVMIIIFGYKTSERRRINQPGDASRRVFATVTKEGFSSDFL